MRQRIKTPPGMGEPIGQYSYGTKASGSSTIWLCGLAGLDDTGNVQAANDMGAQSARIFDRMEKILAEGGATLANVVKLTTFVTTFDGLDGHREQVKKRFKGDYPPGSLIMVKALAKEGMVIEIEAIAVVD
jgi:enamine deaminase RidA (YjgF/YER057c/UK114 family)